MSEVRAAGGIVTRAATYGVELLLIHRPRYDDWSFPKGKAEGAEADEDTALREVTEETGIIATLGHELPTVRYRDRRGRPKRVRYWSMSVHSDLGFEPNDEVDELRWLAPSAAVTLLSYEHDRRLVGEITPAENIE